MKTTSNQTLSKDQNNEKISQALDKIKVDSAKVTENGKKNISKCTNKVNESKVIEISMSTSLATTAKTK